MRQRPIRLPRIRGGVSSLAGFDVREEASSPHTLGCFQQSRRSFVSSPVFPAYAGVFLCALSLISVRLCLPRIRGGVSAENLTEHTISSLPRIRGGVSAENLTEHTISSLPRIRGGVSRPYVVPVFPDESSPHTRGCFYIDGIGYVIETVFPAYAGVFPAPSLLRPPLSSLPRIRGGVSRENLTDSPCVRSSPHTRGCFLSRPPMRFRRMVFPAYAGVFPGLTMPHALPFSLPRIRGGVSFWYTYAGSVHKSSPHTRGCFR